VGPRGSAPEAGRHARLANRRPTPEQSRPTRASARRVHGRSREARPARGS
jgi:hypothetical protein